MKLSTETKKMLTAEVMKLREEKASVRIYRTGCPASQIPLAIRETARIEDRIETLKAEINGGI